LKFDLYFGGTFCVLPWIENFQTVSGKSKFCCWSDKEIDSQKQADVLRDQIWSNYKIPHCENCYSLENNKTISPRQRESILWLKKEDIKKHFDQIPVPPKKPIFLDLRIDNKCNLACISCNPVESSLWSKELGIPLNVSKPKLDYKEILQYQKIYMAGGEPFLINEYLDIIQLVAEQNPNIEIIVNTNLTTVPDDIIQAVKKISNFSLIISVDAFSKVNEYHRYPLKWDKFINNLEKVKDLNIPIQFNTVVDAISIFGLGNLHTISSIPTHWDLSIIKSPSWLKLSNIPLMHKQKALDQIHLFKQNIKFYRTNVSFKTKIDLIEQHVKEQGDESTFLEQIKTLDSRRKINHKDYLGFSLF
jgi:hypothetical protein